MREFLTIWGRNWLQVAGYALVVIMIVGPLIVGVWVSNILEAGWPLVVGGVLFIIGVIAGFATIGSEDLGG